MPIADTDVKWVKPPTLGLMERLYLPAIAQGLGTTIKHMFMRKVTQQFPEERPKLPANYRGVHRLNRDENGRVKCVACYMCSTACPARCIDIVAAASPWPDREKYPEVKRVYSERFRGRHILTTREDGTTRCVACYMCSTACPAECITIQAGEDERTREKFPVRYDIDLLRCIL